MIDLFIATDLAVKGTRAVAWSALPDAPVVTDRPARDPLRRRARAGVAAGLHRVASALEPRARADRTSAVCS